MSRDFRPVGLRQQCGPGSQLRSWQLALLLACGALPLTTVAANQPRLIRAPLGLDDPTSAEAPGRPTQPAAMETGGTLQSKMNMAILLEQQGRAAEARQLYETVLKGLTQHLNGVEAPAGHAQPAGTLQATAQSAIMEAIGRRAPQRHAAHATDTVLLAVNGHGSFQRQAAEDADLGPEAAVRADKGTQLNQQVKNVKKPVSEHHLNHDNKHKDHHKDHDHAAADGKKKNATAGNSTDGGDGDMKGGFLMGVKSEQLIPIYAGIVPIILIVCIVFECIHRRWAAIDLNEPIPNFERGSEAGQGMAVGSWFGGIWPLTKKFFFEGEMKGLAKVLLMVLLFLSFWALFMDWARNIWQRDFWDAIEAKHKNRFWKAMLLFGLMAVVNVLCSTYQSYVTNILTIRWRAALTRDLQEKWLIGRAFCVQHFPPGVQGVNVLDNPDQRLQEDVDSFVGSALNVFFGFVMCIGRLALFTPILFMLSPNYAFGVFYCPGWLLYVSLAYSFLGSVVTHCAGQWLIPLNFIKQQVEADYRHTAIQVRDNTESIALYGSEETEHNRLTSRFDRIQRVVWEQMKFRKQLGFFTNFYFLANDIVPFCILAGNYFRDQITLGQMMQILGALGHVSDSLNAFVGAYSDLADFRATTDRLYGFATAVQKGCTFVEQSTMSKEVSPPGDNAALYAQEVCVRVPAKDGEGEPRVLWDKAGLVVQPGERVLLLGPDGSGKSVFLRALAGCWPATGSVRIGRGDALFIPQRPFVPIGELREAVAYPEAAGKYTDEEIRAVLLAVQLKALDEVPLSEVAEWTRRLSGGELQRLALAHALLRKPGLLVLDETTAAIGEEGTRELYATLGKLLPSSTAIISVDHDAVREVGSWHNVHYTLDESTRKWVLA